MADKRRLLTTSAPSRLTASNCFPSRTAPTRSANSASAPPIYIMRRARMKQIGRASCREGGCQYVWSSVVAVSLKKKYINRTYFNSPSRHKHERSWRDLDGSTDNN